MKRRDGRTRGRPRSCLSVGPYTSVTTSCTASVCSTVPHSDSLEQPTPVRLVRCPGGTQEAEVAVRLRETWVAGTRRQGLQTQ